MKTKILIMTAVLFAIGITSALLIVYDYLTNINDVNASNITLIEKDRASQIAFNEGDWTRELLVDKQVDLTLLHVKNDGFTFLVDEKTLEDASLFMTKLPDLQENQYVWLVQISATGGANREWVYMIDAENGNVIQPTQDISEFEPVNPEIAIKEGTVIQARGDVNIIFPVDITLKEPRQTPFPAQLLITEGDTVTWQNLDSVSHTVTSGYSQQEELTGRIFDSGIIAPSQSFSYTFSDERIDGYHYFCSFHPWETGKIIVQRFE